ncbi:hypothetical protein HEK616_76950 (plasmid) [Streptomyces nigrescens]|uniref:Uncharacterized protein n=1 Tax=Streptomyces nigrescens TaxID=1920 RepID=A0ABM8A6Q9_STRNI|nr:hypothetical protein HEK616_76950 [Streptomyces nigrescens]
MTVDGTGPLTTASGALAADSQDSGPAGAGGPVLVEVQVLPEQVASFKRECAVREAGAGVGSVPGQRPSRRRAGRPAGPVRGICARRPPPRRFPVQRCRR